MDSTKKANPTAVSREHLVQPVWGPSRICIDPTCTQRLDHAEDTPVSEESDMATGQLDPETIQQTALAGTEIHTFMHPARRQISIAATDDGGNAILVTLTFAAARALFEDSLDEMDRIDDQHRANLDLDA